MEKVLILADDSWFFKYLDNYLVKNGYKQTKQRKMIIEHFLRCGPHVEMTRLMDSIKKEDHRIGLATVYRTVSLLQEAGLIEQKNFSDKKTMFEIIDPGNHHDHIICTKCDKITEFQNHEIEALQKKVAEKYGFSLQFYSLDLYGVCQNCRAKETRK